jgi:hypothetical protein
MLSFFKILLYLKISLDFFGIIFLKPTEDTCNCRNTFLDKIQIQLKYREVDLSFCFTECFFYYVKKAPMNCMIDFIFGKVLLAVFKLNSFFFQKCLPLREIKDFKNVFIQFSDDLLSSTWGHMWHGLENE